MSRTRSADIEIRRATAADHAAVAELCVAAYATFVANDHHYVRVLRDAERRAREAELLVAAEPSHGRVLGTVTFVPDGGPLGEIAGAGEAEFRMLAVAPTAQGRGVGAALLRRVVEESRARGKRGIVCSSLPEMRAAHRVYRRLGFARAPERDWSPVPGVELLAFAISLTARPEDPLPPVAKGRGAPALHVPWLPTAANRSPHPAPGTLEQMATSQALVRPRRRVIAGVCSALARRFGVSPALVRVLFVASCLLPGPQVLLYLALWIVLPSE